MRGLTTTALAAVLALAAVTSACNKAAEPAAEKAAAVSETDAAAVADATQAAWTSGDAAKIEAAYAKDVVAFDPSDPPLSTTWENWDKLQKGFAAMKFDHIEVPDRKIQTLDADHFIVSGTGNMTSPSGPMKTAAMRFTDVYSRQPDGKWLIVNEHVSMKPEPQKS
jgi:ketosteroid isomerase-like protein